MDRLPDVLASARIVGAQIVSPGAFAQTKSNPGRDTVREMFKNAGISDVFDRARPKFDARWPKPEASSFLPDKLEEIVGRRNAVAHTVDVRRITRDQLAETHDFLVALAESLDEVLAEHVQHLLQTCAP
jgi:hypothetical protein